MIVVSTDIAYISQLIKTLVWWQEKKHNPYYFNNKNCLWILYIFWRWVSTLSDTSIHLHFWPTEWLLPFRMSNYRKQNSSSRIICKILTLLMDRGTYYIALQCVCQIKPYVWADSQYNWKNKHCNKRIGSDKQWFYSQKQCYSQSAWESEGWDEEKWGLQQASSYTCICYDSLLYSLCKTYVVFWQRTLVFSHKYTE